MQAICRRPHVGGLRAGPLHRSLGQVSARRGKGERAYAPVESCLLLPSDYCRLVTHVCCRSLAGIGSSWGKARPTTLVPVRARAAGEGPRPNASGLLVCVDAGSSRKEIGQKMPAPAAWSSLCPSAPPPALARHATPATPSLQLAKPARLAAATVQRLCRR